MKFIQLVINHFIPQIDELRRLRIKCAMQEKWIDSRMRKSGEGYDNPLKNTVATWQRKADRLHREMPEVWHKYFSKTADKG